MQRRQYALVLALNTLGKKLSLSSFDERLALQKLVLLVEKAGVHLGYNFSWYLHGPYSPTLTEEAFEALGELQVNPDSCKGWILDPTSQDRLSSLKLALDRLPNDNLSPAKQLEIVASTLWALDQGWASPNRPQALHTALLDRGKKHFKPEQVKEALRWLRQYEFIKAA